MNELLSALIAQQKRDDSSHQDPQRFAGVRTVPLQKFVDHGRDGADIETVRDTVDHGATEVGGVARPQTRWGPGRMHPVHRPRTIQDRDAMFRACEDLLTSLPTDKEQTVRTVVYEQYSQRAAAVRYGVSQPAIFKRLKTAYAAMRLTLEARSGSGGMDFPMTRDVLPGCRAPKCEHHFVEADCVDPGCITVLPKHYNPHTTCRIHTGEQSRAEFNEAFLLGAAIRGGLDARSTAALDSTAVAV